MGRLYRSHARCGLAKLRDSRECGDLFASKEREDVVTVLDRHPSLVAELGREPVELIAFLHKEIG